MLLVPREIIHMGMLFFTLIVGPGYFAQKDQLAPAAIFVAILILVLASALTVI